MNDGDGRTPIAVTFDDGYRDNLLTATPILERYATPATVFVTTAMIDCECEPWWDELGALCVRQPDAAG